MTPTSHATTRPSTLVSTDPFVLHLCISFPFQSFTHDTQFSTKPVQLHVVAVRWHNSLLTITCAHCHHSFTGPHCGDLSDDHDDENEWLPAAAELRTIRDTATQHMADVGSPLVCGVCDAYFPKHQRHQPTPSSSSFVHMTTRRLSQRAPENFTNHLLNDVDNAELRKHYTLEGGNGVTIHASWLSLTLSRQGMTLDTETKAGLKTNEQFELKLPLRNGARVLDAGTTCTVTATTRRRKHQYTLNVAGDDVQDVDWKSVVTTDTHRLNVCATCTYALSKNRLPKFAVANGLQIGGLSCAKTLADLSLTSAEWDLLSACRTRKRIEYVYASSSPKGDRLLRPKLRSHVVQLQVANHAFGKATDALHKAGVKDLPATTVCLASSLQPGEEVHAAVRASQAVTVRTTTYATACNWLKANSDAFADHPDIPPHPNLDANGLVVDSFHVEGDGVMSPFRRIMTMLTQSAHDGDMSAADVDDRLLAASCADFAVYSFLIQHHYDVVPPRPIAELAKRLKAAIRDRSCLHAGTVTAAEWQTHRHQHVVVPPAAESPSTPPREPHCLLPTALPALDASKVAVCRVPPSTNLAANAPLETVASFTKATAEGHGRATLLTDTMQPVAPTVDAINAAIDPVTYSIVHSAGDGLYESWNPKNIVRAFTNLFPYGKGHPTDSRRIAISLQAYVQHVLGLSSQAFAECDDFIFQTFDVLNKSKSHASLSACLRSDPSASTRASKISVDDLRAAALHAAAVSDSLRKQRPLPTPPPNGAATELLRSLASSRKHMFGTVEHALDSRHKLFAMEHMFGAHGVWMTTSPDDVGDPHLRRLVLRSDSWQRRLKNVPVAQATVPGASGESQGTQPATHVAQFGAEAVCANSGMTAWHFSQSMLILQNELCMRADGDAKGVFGRCIAFAGMTEEQKRLSLHQHACLHVEALPCTVQSLASRVLKNPKRLDRLMKYIDKVETSDHTLRDHEFDREVRTLKRARHDADCTPRVDASAAHTLVADAVANGADPYLALAAHLLAPAGVDDVLVQPPPSSDYVVDPVPHSYRNFLEPRPHLPHPDNVRCDACHEHFASTHDVFTRWATARCDPATRALLDAGDVAVAVDLAQAARTDDDDGQESERARATLMLLMLKEMFHTPGHRKGCFKRKDNAKKSSCRFRRPVVAGTERTHFQGTFHARTTSVLVNGKPVRTSSDAAQPPRPADHYYQFDASVEEPWKSMDSIEVVVTRKRGCEYVSNYNPTHLEVFRCNTNVRVVCASPGQLYYTTTYATKVPDAADSTSRMVSAFERAVHRHESSNKDAASKGVSLAFTLFNAFTSTMEIPSTIAALWLLRPNKDINYYSHAFVNVHLNLLDNYVNNKHHTMYHFVPARKTKVPAPNTDWSAAFGNATNGDDDDATHAQHDAAADVADDATAHAPPTFLAPPDGNFVPSHQAIVDYQHRPASMKNMAFFWFISLYHRTSCSAPSADETKRFLKSHPQHATSMLTKRAIQCVPKFTGKRMPDTDAFDIKNSADPQARRYCCLALALYKPWSQDHPLRTADDDHDVLPAWTDAYDEWINSTRTDEDHGHGHDDATDEDHGPGHDNATLLDHAKHMLKHHQHYYLSKKIAGTSTARQNLSDQVTLNSSFCPPVDFDSYDLAQMEQSVADSDALAPFPTKSIPVRLHNYLTEASGPRPPLPSSDDHDARTATLAQLTTAMKRRPITHVPQFTDLVKCPTCRVHHQPDHATGTHGQQSCASCNTHGPSPSHDDATLASNAVIVDSAEVGGALQNTVAASAAKHAHRHGLKPMPAFPTPAEAVDHAQTSTGHAWNAEQRATFTFGAAVIVRIFLNSQRDRAGIPALFRHHARATLKSMGVDGNDPCTCFISGQGGSGKSTIIKALLAFASAWNVADLVQPSAYIGTAAVAIGGVTTIQHTQARRPKKVYGTPLQQQRLHIIDEVSLMGQADLGLIDKSLRQIKRTNQPFGGADVFFIGDHSQLPPVKRCPLWRRPDSDDLRAMDMPAGASHQSESVGFAVWNNLSHAFFLSQNFRAKKDPDYQQFLARVREGAISTSDYDRLRQRRIANAGLPPVHATHVMHTRATVAAVNHHMVHVAAAAAGKTMHRTHPRVLLADGTVLPTSHAALQGFAVTTDKADLDPQTSFDFYVGMNVSLPNKNENIRTGIANGTTAVVVGTIPPLHTLAATTRTEHTHGTTPRAVRVLHDQPEAILVFNPAFDVHFAGLPRGVVPITLVDKTIDRLPLCPCSAKITYFPLRHTFARTCHVLQGATLASMVLGAVCTNVSGWLYTALSRVGSWDDLFLLDGISMMLFERACKMHDDDKTTDVERLLKLSTTSFANVTAVTQGTLDADSKQPPHAAKQTAAVQPQPLRHYTVRVLVHDAGDHPPETKIVVDRCDSIANVKNKVVDALDALKFDLCKHHPHGSALHCDAAPLDEEDDETTTAAHRITETSTLHVWSSQPPSNSDDDDVPS